MALTTPIETTDERPSCCGYAAGRVFYGMKNSVYYSQLMEGESVDFLNRCYSKNDPTAEQLSDLLDTDGGVMQIDEAVNIKQIESFATGVLIYAQNGVWYLSGPESGFTATNFSRTKVSSSGIASPQSVIDVEGTQFYWSREGIFVISLTEFGNPAAQNLIEGTLQTFYNDIPVESREKCSGSYNRIKKQIEWHYSSTAQDGATDYKYAHELSLVYDLRTQSFWPQEYNTNKQELQGSFLVSGVKTNAATLAQEIAYLTIKTGAVSGTQDYSVDFATKTDVSFQDTGINYPRAYIETGYEALDKPSNVKSAPSTSLHFNQTEENFIDDGLGGLMLDLQSGCQLSAKWDWNDSSANGRWSPTQQAYKFRRTFIPDIAGPFNSGESVVSTKMKVLGRGKALSLRFEQEDNKDMQLMGYTTTYSVKGRM